MTDTIFKATSITCSVIIMITGILQYAEMRNNRKNKKTKQK